MSDIVITVQNDATGSITIDGTPQPINTSSVPATRQAAIQQAQTHARTAGQTLEVTANDPDGTFHLAIQPDGTVTNRPAPTSWEQPPAQAAPETQPEAVPEPPTTTGSHAAPTATPPPPEPVPAEPTAAEPVPEPVPEPTPSQAPAPDTEPVPPQAAPAAPTPAIQEPPPPADAPTTDAGPITEPKTAQIGPDPLPAEPTPEVAVTDPVEDDPRWADVAAQPATQGIRGSLNKFGMKFAPHPSELDQRREELRATIRREDDERAEAERHAAEEADQESRREARAREQAERDQAQRALIQTNLESAKTVSFMNEKGGVGKTTDTYCLGATFGRIRSGDVIAWDANETRGTLGFRAQKDHHSRSVVDLLEEAAAEFSTVQGSRRSTIMRYARQQGDSQFGVIASDESRDRQDLVDAEAFETIHEILGRFYSLVLIDTGNNHRVSHFKAALAATDQLVIPVSAGADGAYAAQVMMDNLIGLGYGDLVKNAIVLLHDSATRRGDARDVAAKFQDRVRAILPIPFDPALDNGNEIDFDALQPATRAAYQEAAATIASGLMTTTHRATQKAAS